jgi:hypothetical protein
MFPKHRLAYPLVFCLLLIFISAGLFYLVSSLLPAVLESKIISILKKDSGLNDFTLDIQQLGLRGASLGALRIGPPQDPALVIHSLRIAYSLGEIYRKRIKKMTAGGVELYCAYENGRWRLGSLDFDQFLKRLQSMQGKDSVHTHGPMLFFPERIEIRNGLLIGRVGDKIDRIPFELDVARSAAASTLLNFAIRIYPRGQLVEAFATLDIANNRVAIQVAADNLELLRFADIFERMEGLDISGFARLQLKVDLQLAPFRVLTTAGRLRGYPLSLRYKGLQYSSLAGHSNRPNPLIVEIAGRGMEKWNISVSDLGPVAPLTAAVTGIEATVQRSANGYAIFGNSNLVLGAATAASIGSVPLIFDRPLELPLTFSVRHTQNDSWQFDLSSRQQKPADTKSTSLRYGPIRLVVRSPQLHLDGSSKAGNLNSTYTLRLPDVRLSSDVVNISFPQFVLKGQTEFGPDSLRDLQSIFDLNLSGAVIKMNATEIKLNDLTAGARWQMNQKGLQALTGDVKFANTNLDSANLKLRFRQAQGRLPLKFPIPETGEKGVVKIATVGYQTLALGAVDGQIQQTASGLSFRGNLINGLLPQLTATLSASAEFLGTGAPQTRIDFALSYPETGPEIDLGKLLPAAAGFTFQGKFSEKASLVIAKERMSAEAESSLTSGELMHRENKIAIENIQMDLLIPDLLTMRSAPGQKLKFGRASIAGLNIENGEIVFQIESPRSLLIERSRFRWCDGKVDAPAIRLRPGVEDYSLILYCDRLNLAKVLEQFGVASVEAGGQLNGQIPLRYKNGRLSFRDGFLFTTPGEPGKIRMTDTEVLTAGIPPDTPQYVQMELARKALEDYDYSWAKLNLTTEGEDLLLKMQLDGKPGKPLPFVYRKDLGGFAKVEADVQGSTFQGIRLDVNFRLPLNKIMQYKELIQMIQKGRE